MSESSRGPSLSVLTSAVASSILTSRTYTTCLQNVRIFLYKYSFFLVVYLLEICMVVETSTFIIKL